MKAAMNLKHKAFADEYISNGFNGKDAYLKIYPKVADSTATVNASKLLNDTNIQGYILDIQAKLEKKSLITKEEIIKDLLEIKDLYKKEGKFSHNSIRAIENINRMLGYNEAEKIDIKAEIENKTLRDYLDFNE
jgi:fumarate hydratase class II